MCTCVTFKFDILCIISSSRMKNPEFYIKHLEFASYKIPKQKGLRLFLSPEGYHVSKTYPYQSHIIKMFRLSYTALFDLYAPQCMSTEKKKRVSK